MTVQTGVLLDAVQMLDLPAVAAFLRWLGEQGYCVAEELPGYEHNEWRPYGTDGELLAEYAGMPRSAGPALLKRIADAETAQERVERHAANAGQANAAVWELAQAIRDALPADDIRVRLVQALKELGLGV